MGSRCGTTRTYFMDIEKTNRTLELCKPLHQSFESRHLILPLVGEASLYQEDLPL